MKEQEWKFDPDPDYPLGPGEWDNEPDKVQYIDKDTQLPCLIVRNPFGALCGYVGVRKDHPLFGRSYDARVPYNERSALTLGSQSPLVLLSEALREEDGTVRLDALFDAHGGLTFSGSCQEGGKICHVVDDGEDDSVWWFGFDCAHAGDLVPGFSRYRFFQGDNTYRNISYVREQNAALAKQLTDYARQD